MANVSGTFSTNQTWSENMVMTGDVIFNSGAKLTINAGILVEVNANVTPNIHIEFTGGAYLVAVGTLGNEITFESDKGVPLVNDWDGIYIKADAGLSSFDMQYVVIKDSDYNGGHGGGLAFGTYFETPDLSSSTFDHLTFDHCLVGLQVNQATATVTNCTFTNCTNAVFHWNGNADSITIEDSTFTSCTYGFDGGVPPNFTRCTFDTCGRGIYAIDNNVGSPTIQLCKFQDCTTVGLWLATNLNGSYTVTNCVIEDCGTGLHIANVPVTLKNTIIANSPTKGVNRISGTLSSTYNCLYGNAANTGYSAGTGDISDDPLFVDEVANDYNLQTLGNGDPANSPCAGTGTATGAPVNDFDGVAWPNASPEMGVYGAAVAVDVSVDRSMPFDAGQDIRVARGMPLDHFGSVANPVDVPLDWAQVVTTDRGINLYTWPNRYLYASSEMRYRLFPYRGYVARPRYE